MGGMGKMTRAGRSRGRRVFCHVLGLRPLRLPGLLLYFRQIPGDIMPAAKTPTKKTAKTAKKPVKKTAKKVTIDDVWAIIAEMGKSNEQFKAEHIKTEKALRELANSHEETEKAIRELREEHKITEKTLRDANRATEKTLNKAIGGISNTMGALVEKFMTAGLPQKFKQFGFTFNHVTTVKWASGENNIYTEIDGLLENGKQAMAVEVKTTLRQDDVDDHLIRMERVRKYANEHGDAREFFGAIAATIVENSARAYALKKGFFVIEPSGEDVKITKPAAEKAW